MEEQLDQGQTLETCPACGAQSTGQSERQADIYQIVVACAQCGNEFAALSRN